MSHANSVDFIMNQSWLLIGETWFSELTLPNSSWPVFIYVSIHFVFIIIFYVQEMNRPFCFLMNLLAHFSPQGWSLSFCPAVIAQMWRLISVIISSWDQRERERRGDTKHSELLWLLIGVFFKCETLGHSGWRRRMLRHTAAASSG